MTDTTLIEQDLLTPEQEYRRVRIEQIRAFADWAEANPSADVDLSSGEVSVWKGNADAMAEAARELGGRWTKRTTDYYFYLEREVVPGIVYKLYCDRETVCTAVVTGKTTVKVKDPDALAAVPMIEQERDVVEWRCPDSLLQMTAENAAEMTPDGTYGGAREVSS